MPDDLYRANLVLCVILDTDQYKNIHAVLVKHCDEESKSRGFDGWVDAYHRMVPHNVKL